MCKAFSAVVVRSGKVYWKFGMDSHEDIKDEFKLDDRKFGLCPVERKFGLCPVEISPKNNNYLKPDEWVFKFDDGIPDWWKASHEKHCWEAFKKWKKKLNKMLIPKEIVSPFEMSPPKKITTKHIRLLEFSLGFSRGFSRGFGLGFSRGFSLGFSRGFGRGFSRGFSLGFSRGFSWGFSQGFSLEFSQGFSWGFGQGFGQGLRWFVLQTAEKVVEIHKQNQDQRIPIPASSHLMGNGVDSEL